jgi:hypothetical protein
VRDDEDGGARVAAIGKIIGLQLQLPLKVIVSRQQFHNGRLAHRITRTGLLVQQITTATAAMRTHRCGLRPFE